MLAFRFRLSRPVAFDRKKLVVARFSTDVVYHTAYNYLSLKGLLAERWAHGPVFGAFQEGAYQIDLSPGPNEPEGPRAFYGIKQSGFTVEPVEDVKTAVRLSNAWHGDVIEVLEPKRVVRLQVNWFLTYPVRNPDAASKRVRDRYYKPSELGTLRPERYSSYHSAVENFIAEGPDRWTLVVGVVGPPHEGQFFSRPVEGRDDRWWMGVRLTLIRVKDDGFENPLDELKEMIAFTDADLDRVITKALPALVD